jgi:LmbE family N-acetylglucosaminyl deacetylase
MIINETEIYPYLTSDLSDKNCIVIAPHPDDESIGCGGSIVKHIKNGSRVKILFLTSGNKGDFKRAFGDDYIRIRRESALKAVSILGAKDYEFLEFRDRELYKGKSIIYEMIKKRIEEFQPELIYVPSPYEAHPDHRVAALIAWQIFNETGIGIAFYELLMSLNPNILIDISDEFRKKKEAIRCYRTELRYNNYIDKIEGLNRFRTATLDSHVKYAEAFLMLDQNHSKDTSVILLKNLIATI